MGVSMLIFFRKKFQDFWGSTIPPTDVNNSPGAPGSFETFATCQLKSGIYQKRRQPGKTTKMQHPGRFFNKEKESIRMSIFHDCVGLIWFNDTKCFECYF